MLADNVLGSEIVLKISYLPSKLRFSAEYSFFGQSLSRGHYQPTYIPAARRGLFTICNQLELRARHGYFITSYPTRAHGIIVIYFGFLRLTVNILAFLRLTVNILAFYG